jgi:hypothetical protein
LAFIAISGALLGHDPEKWKPVFGQDHAPANTWWFAAESREFGAGRLCNTGAKDRQGTDTKLQMAESAIF